MKIYQSYYNRTQLPELSPDCISFDNTKNQEPTLREYPLFKKVYELEKDTGDYWGLISPRFKEKTLLEPKEFKEWIQNNPGYDVYYIDPFLDISVYFTNLWVQGEKWHPGLIKYFERLIELISPSQIITCDTIIYHPDDFVTCNFFVGNKYFWDSYFSFVDSIIKISKNDTTLNHYMFEHKVVYNGAEINYFSFIIERLLSLFFYFYQSINKKKFPIEHECFRKKYGDNHQQLINMYKSKL